MLIEHALQTCVLLCPHYMFRVSPGIDENQPRGCVESRFKTCEKWQSTGYRRLPETRQAGTVS